ncbi:MAG: DUF362 domain-containing protein [Candidatus Nanoarchaeia archaeon]|nr:DUF362 domain-containing protein [Candidatus Nanoarchaeia archaeon]
MISRVAISKGINRLDSANKALDLLGGMARYVNKGDTVFIKPNFMSGIGMLANTHPDLVRFAVHKCLKSGAKKIYVGDTAMSQIDGEKAFSWTKIKEYVERHGGTMLNLESSVYKEKEFNGILSKKIMLPEEFLESDVYINMPKMKTHCITKFTGGIKNSLGLLRDNDKRTNHSFERLDLKLLDIVRARKPDLVIVDSYIAMEGEGPILGEPVKTGYSVVGNDVIAVDSVCCKLMGIEPSDIKSIVAGEKLGDGTSNPRVSGEKIENLAKRFKIPSKEIKDVGGIKHYISNENCGCPSVLRISNSVLISLSKMFPYLFSNSEKKINIVSGNYKGETRQGDITILVGDCACASYSGNGEKIIKIQKQCGVKAKGEEKPIECPATDSWISLFQTICKELGGPLELEIVKSLMEIAKQ